MGGGEFQSQQELTQLMFSPLTYQNFCVNITIGPGSDHLNLPNLIKMLLI